MRKGIEAIVNIPWRELRKHFIETTVWDKVKKKKKWKERLEMEFQASADTYIWEILDSAIYHLGWEEKEVRK